MAFGILTIGMLGVSSLVLQNIRVQAVNRDNLIASMLAQEGLELVRNIRDNNWLNGWSWLTDINEYSDNSFAIDYSDPRNGNAAPNAVGDPGTELYLDGNNFYNHTGGSATPFARIISIYEPAGGNYIAASSTVRWTDSSGAHDYVAETLFYDWR